MEVVAAQRIPLVLRLLDHQLVGGDGELLGNVDDLELQEVDGQILVTGLLSGPAALADRQDGRAGRWLRGAWRRLHPDADPKPLVIPLTHVTTLDSAVKVSALAQRALMGSAGVELWLREHVISRLPGALGGEDRTKGSLLEHRERHQEFAQPADGLALSRLLGLEVEAGDGQSLGTVIEVTAEAFERTGLELGRLRVVDLVCSPRHLGQELGYTMGPQGPAALGLLLRFWHREDVRFAVTDVEHIDWSEQRIILRPDATLRHPHDDGDASGT